MSDKRGQQCEYSIIRVDELEVEEKTEKNKTKNKTKKRGDWSTHSLAPSAHRSAALEVAESQPLAAIVL